jgi:hydroxylysine kinase
VISFSPAATELEQPPPQLDSDEAEIIAFNHFFVRGRARMLESERDRNFLIFAEDGRFVLKVVNRAEPAEISAFQAALAEHIADYRADLPVAAIVRDRNGISAPVARLRNGESHIVRMAHFLPGSRAAELPLSDREAEVVGSALARLDLVLARFPGPTPQVDILWNISAIEKVRSLTTFIPDSDLRIQVEKVVDRWGTDVAPSLGRLRRQVIHNDLNRYNLLLDPHGGVSGIIDFGDALEAPLICELATAISYQLEGGAGDVIRIAATAAAYHAVLPLVPAEIELLGDLVRARWAITIAITHWRASLHPQNAPYILRNVAAARNGLNSLDRWHSHAITDNVLARLNLN